MLFGRPRARESYCRDETDAIALISAAVTSGFINQWFQFGPGYDNIFTKCDQDDQMHGVEQIQERHFLEIKKSNAKKYTGFGLRANLGKGGWVLGMLGYRARM